MRISDWSSDVCSSDLTEGPSRIVVNGVGLGPNGQVTGLDALQLLTIGGAAPVAGSYDRRSTVNGCLISSPTVCATVALDSSEARGVGKECVSTSSSRWAPVH